MKRKPAPRCFTVPDPVVRLGEIAALLRETAKGARDGSLKPFHIANRLDKIANEIDGGRQV
jgi:hypothetical protein